MTNYKSDNKTPASRRKRSDDPQELREEVIPSIAQVTLTTEKPLKVSVKKMPCDGRIHSHFHLALEVGVILSGHVEQNQGEGWFDLRPGQIWSCYSLEIHRWRVIRPTVELRFDLLPSLLTQIPNFNGLDPSAVFHRPNRSRAFECSQNLRRSLKEFGCNLAEKCQQELSLAHVYIELLRLFEKINAEATKRVIDSPLGRNDLAANSRIQAAFELIANSPERRVSVTEAACACGMAKSTFTKIFKKITGLGFSDFALRSRLEKVAHMLKHSDSPLKMLADDSGFRDESHLHRAFIAQYQMTPGAYRTAQSLVAKL